MIYSAKWKKRDWMSGNLSPPRVGQALYVSKPAMSGQRGYKLATNRYRIIPIMARYGAVSLKRDRIGFANYANGLFKLTTSRLASMNNE